MSRRYATGQILTRVAEGLYLTALIAGCGDAQPSDVEQVMAAISDLPDAARDAEFFDSLFVAGAAPAAGERARYSQYIFNADEPTVTAQSAKVNIRITNADGDDLGTQEWVFARDDGQWKIEQAPLPR